MEMAVMGASCTVRGKQVSLDGPPHTETLESVMLLKEGIHHSIFL